MPTATEDRERFLLKHKRPRFAMLYESEILSAEYMKQPASVHRVYQVLCLHAPKNGDGWELRISDLAKQTCMTKRSVYRALERLEELGYIDRHSGSSFGAPSAYAVPRNRPPEGGDNPVPPSDAGGDSPVRGGVTAVTPPLLPLLQTQEQTPPIVPQPEDQEPTDAERLLSRYYELVEARRSEGKGAGLPVEAKRNPKHWLDLLTKRLKQHSYEDLLAVIEFAFLSAHPTAKFWRGERDEGQVLNPYMSLPSLIRPKKLDERVAVAAGFSEVREPPLKQALQAQLDSPSVRRAFPDDEAVRMLLERAGVWWEELARAYTRKEDSFESRKLFNSLMEKIKEAM